MLDFHRLPPASTYLYTCNMSMISVDLFFIEFVIIFSFKPPKNTSFSEFHQYPYVNHNNFLHVHFTIDFSGFYPEHFVKTHKTGYELPRNAYFFLLTQLSFQMNCVLKKHGFWRLRRKRHQKVTVQADLERNSVYLLLSFTSRQNKSRTRPTYSRFSRK